jgi:hypothetical protein
MQNLSISQREFNNSQAKIDVTSFFEFSQKLPRILIEKTFLRKKGIKEKSKYSLFLTEKTT